VQERDEAVAEQLIRKDAPIMLGVSLLTLVLAADGGLGSLDGVFLLLGFIAYTYFALRQSRAENVQVQEEYAGEFSQKETPTAKRLIFNSLFIAGGLGLLALGADWLVQAAVRIARALGVNELVIGLTIVAAGTSLPEAATSVIAAFKKESDIAVGNAVGSNIYNLLGVLGIGALAARGGIPVPTHVLHFDMPVMIFVALAALPVFFIGSRISRLEGMLFISYFALYMVYIVMESRRSPYLPAVKSLGLFYVSVTFLVLTAAAFLSARGKAAG
jgi:cation:H+ antiporter